MATNDHLFDMIDTDAIVDIHAFRKAMATYVPHATGRRDNKNTLLMVACRRGRTDVVRVLVELYPEREHVVARDISGWTALMLAAVYDEPECVTALCAAVTDPGLRIELIRTRGTVGRGWTALMIAAHWGYADVVEVLLEMCPSAVEDTCANDPTKNAEALIEQGDTEKTRAVFATFWEKKRSATKDAASGGRVACVRNILEHAVRPEQLLLTPNGEGETALMCAMQYGHVDCVRVILAAVSNPTRTRMLLMACSAGWTVLMRAASYGDNVAVQMLIAAVPEPDQKKMIMMETINGFTALMIATAQNNASVVRELLRVCPETLGQACMLLAIPDQPRIIRTAEDMAWSLEMKEVFRAIRAERQNMRKGLPVGTV